MGWRGVLDFDDDDGERETKGGKGQTFFMLSANRSYSSRTSCSVGVSSGGEPGWRAEVGRVMSILLAL